jgi:hypothetical protein
MGRGRGCGGTIGVEVALLGMWSVDGTEGVNERASFRMSILDFHSEEVGGRITLGSM